MVKLIHAPSLSAKILCAIAALLMLIATVVDAAAGPNGGVECAISNVRSFRGWSDAAQKIWLVNMGDALAGRVRVFQIEGEFRPLTYPLNGNTAGIVSASFARVERKMTEVNSAKVRVGFVQGTEIPVYEIKSGQRSEASNLIDARDVTFLLPVKVEDLPSGAVSKIQFDANCTVTGSGGVEVSREQPPAPKRRFVRASVRPQEN